MCVPVGSWDDQLCKNWVVETHFHKTFSKLCVSNMLMRKVIFSVKKCCGKSEILVFQEKSCELRKQFSKIVNWGEEGGRGESIINWNAWLKSGNLEMTPAPLALPPPQLGFGKSVIKENSRAPPPPLIALKEVSYMKNMQEDYISWICKWPVS